MNRNKANGSKLISKLKNWLNNSYYKLSSLKIIWPKNLQLWPLLKFAPMNFCKKNGKI